MYENYVRDGGERALRQDVAEVVVRYATGIDRRDWELFRSCFADDCKADYGEIGSWPDADAMTEWMRQAHTRCGQTLHRVTNQDVALSGNGATARCYLDALVMTADNLTIIQTVGFCDDELVYTAEGWKIARRQYTRVLSRNLRNDLRSET